MKHVAECAILNCDYGSFDTRLDTAICPRCRANIAVNEKKLEDDPGWARRRVANLERYSDRLSYVVPKAVRISKSNSSNIVHFKLGRRS